MNAAARQNGLTYSTLMKGLKSAGVALDRKILADICVRDAATFARIAEVASVDLHLLAQLRPGDRLRFELVSLAQAQALHLCREQEMVAIREAVERHMTL